MKRSVRAFFAILGIVISILPPVLLGQPTTQAVVNPPALRLVPTTSDIGLSALVPAQPVPHPVAVRPPQLSPQQIAHYPPPPQPGPGPLPPGILAWDAELKEATAKTGEPTVQFVFAFTNVSPGEVAINYVQTSCGCTTAQLPPLPWRLAPGTNGAIPVNLSLAGKSGVVFKTITVNTDKGWKMLTVKTTILPPPVTPMTAADRERNQQIVKADRQAVFKGDCARCHVEPVIGKMGKDLFVSACGICHEAEHRATMVADLHTLKQETNAEYWKNWITNGKEGSLMPAFAVAKGGPLSDPQISSLVDYLVQAIPSKPTTAANAAGAKGN